MRNVAHAHVPHERVVRPDIVTLAVLDDCTLPRPGLTGEAHRRDCRTCTARSRVLPSMRKRRRNVHAAHRIHDPPVVLLACPPGRRSAPPVRNEPIGRPVVCEISRAHDEDTAASLPLIGEQAFSERHGRSVGRAPEIERARLRIESVHEGQLHLYGVVRAGVLRRLERTGNPLCKPVIRRKQPERCLVALLRSQVHGIPRAKVASNDGNGIRLRKEPTQGPIGDPARKSPPGMGNDHRVELSGLGRQFPLPHIAGGLYAFRGCRIPARWKHSRPWHGFTVPRRRLPCKSGEDRRFFEPASLGKGVHRFPHIAYNSAMNRRFGLLYTIFSLVVLVVLVVLVLVRLNTARALNIDEAEASYRRLQSELRTESVTLDRVPDILRDYASIVPSVDALVFYHPELGIRYAWSSTATLVAISRSELDDYRGFPAYRLSEVTQYQVRDPISLSGDASSRDGAFYLDAVYTVLGFDDAYLPLRDSLISLLIFAFLTVLVLLGLNRPVRDAEPQDGSPVRAATSEARPGEEEPTGNPRHATASPAAGRDRESASSQPIPQPEPHEAPAQTAVSPGADGRFSYEEISLEEVATDPGEPGTLFNPVTGLSHREHLDRRLSLELERSAYNDQDLTCLLVRFPQLEQGEPYVEKAGQILATFQFEDLCFEYDENTFCVILPNTELPQGIRQAEAFRKRHPDALLGLSARNGRLVEAQRVLKEAERSLSHAASEPGGIVGFRPDPRKYRQFVTQQLDGE